MPTSKRGRTLAAVVAGGALTGTSLLVGATPAAASYPSPTIHYCGSLDDPVADDGPVTDGIHHNVEPLLGGLDNGLVHAVNCGVLATLLRI